MLNKPLLDQSSNLTNKELEAKLELLHNCLTVDGAKLQILPSELEDDEVCKKAFNDFKGHPSDEQPGEALADNNHFARLSVLRNTLLFEY